MSLLFNILSRFVIAFLLRSKCLLISWLQSLSTVILLGFCGTNPPEYQVHFINEGCLFPYPELYY